MKKTIVIYLLLIVLLFLSFALSISSGSSGISLAELFSGDERAHLIIFSLRLPRFLAACFAGSALALSGLLLQGASGNELASPNTIGVNAGSGFAVLLFLSFMPELFAFLPLAAFIGASSAVFLVLMLSSMISSIDTKSSLILSGVAIGALFNAGISALSAINPEVLASYSAFSIGGFSLVSYDELKVPFALIIIFIIISFFFRGRLNILALGDEVAASFGIKVKSLRFLLLALSAALASSAVSFAGLLGFVGLIVPHIASFLVGEDYRKRFPITLLLGSLLVSIADYLGRILLPPSELPAGIFLSLLGVPFFIVLMLRRRKR